MKYVFPAFYTMLENKLYTEENTTKQEIEAIRSRVGLCEDRIVCYHELPQQSIFSVDLVFDEFLKYKEELGTFCVLVDLSEAGRPSAETRVVLNQRFASFRDVFIHTFFYTGKNRVINTAIRFLMYGSGYINYSVCSNYEDALNAAKNVLEQK